MKIKETAKNIIKAEFTKFTKGENWVSGTVGQFHFQAKLFDVGSIWGIKDGRVSKLSIWDEEIRQETKNFFAGCIVNFDRGWDIKPKKFAKPYYNAVMKLLESAPKLFD